MEDLKNKLLNSFKTMDKIKKTDYLSTGSTLLDLACSDTLNGGFVKGRYYFLVGDSASGKTFLSLTCLAEACMNDNFKDYRFIYDNSEGGALMDIEQFFGATLAEKLEAPKYEDEVPLYSSSIEEFYYNVDDAIKSEKPFIYILDSMDSLTSEPEIDKFEEHKEAYSKGRQTAGSYGDGKAKINSANLRRLMSPLRESGSILIIITQTRDNLGFGFAKKTRSGGHALRFYACLELWSSIKERLYKTVGGKKRQLGITCQVDIKKNRITGKERTITIPIYYSYGFDDIGSCVEYLLDEGVWKMSGKTINATDFKITATKEKLIGYIEEKNLEETLKALVGNRWQEVEEKCAAIRKKRYE